MSGLPWIKVWTRVTGHPKVQRLESELGIRDALGVVIRLWAWTADYAPSGEITEAEALTACLFARGEATRAKPDAILLAFRNAGLLDPVPGGFRVHDWHDLQTVHLEAEEKRKAQARDRQAAYRARHGLSATVTPSGNRDVTRDVTRDSVTEIEKETEKEKEIPGSNVSRIPAPRRDGGVKLGPLGLRLIHAVEQGLNRGLLPLKTQDEADDFEALVTKHGVDEALSFVAATCRKRNTDPQSVAWVAKVLSPSAGHGGVQ